jgi:uncharacterized membrane protein AbrB (regulator of aidB expression)
MWMGFGMKPVIKPMLPQDTQAIDVMSFGNIVIMLIVSLLTTKTETDLPTIIIAATATISFISIYLNRMTPLRVFTQWILGMLFAYTATSEIARTFNSHSATMLILGLSNFYAAIININLLLEKE